MIKLTPFNNKVLAKVIEWHSDLDKMCELTVCYEPRTPEQILNLFNSWLSDNTIKLFAILDNNDCIGYAMLKNIDWIHRCAEIHLDIAEQQNKGHAHTVFKLLTDYAFNNLNLRRISLWAIEEKKQLIQYFECRGFINEGILKKALYRNGKYQDVYLYGLLKDEYKGGQD